VLQGVAGCCRVLQGCSVLQGFAVNWMMVGRLGVLQRVAGCRSVLQGVAGCCRTLQDVAVYCSVSQCGRT